MFLFVVALGTDYNIRMTARLREETLAGRSVPQAVADAVRHVAPERRPFRISDRTRG